MVLMGVLENRKKYFSALMAYCSIKVRKIGVCVYKKQPLCYEKYVFGLLKHFFDISLF